LFWVSLRIRGSLVLVIVCPPPKLQSSLDAISAMVTGHLAHTPNLLIATSWSWSKGFMDWTSSRLVNSRTSQLVDWTSCGRKLCTQSRRQQSQLLSVVPDLHSILGLQSPAILPQVDQSMSCPGCQLAFCKLAYP